MIDILVPGSRVSVWYADGCSVGLLDRVDEFDVYVDGVRIPRSIIVDVEGPEHPEGPCDDYRCCIG